VVFVTHYLEEADAFADRVVVMHAGVVVADGPVTRVKAAAGTPAIRATLPAVDARSLADLPGVTAVERHGDVIELRSANSDASLRALVASYPQVRDVEVPPAPLEPGQASRRRQLRSVLHGRDGDVGHDDRCCFRRVSDRSRAIDGWMRQLRITPLRTSTYFGSKILSSYTLALAALLLHYGAGIALGIRLATASWVEMTSLLLIGLVPFALLGIVLGLLLNAELMGPAIGGTVAAFALFGGVWGPLSTTGVLHTVLSDLPSYWLVQAGRLSLQDRWWPGHAWVVLGVWTLVLSVVSVRRYRRVTNR